MKSVWLPVVIGITFTAISLQSADSQDLRYYPGLSYWEDGRLVWYKQEGDAGREPFKRQAPPYGEESERSKVMPQTPWLPAPVRRIARLAKPEAKLGHVTNPNPNQPVWIDEPEDDEEESAMQNLEKGPDPMGQKPKVTPERVAIPTTPRITEKPVTAPPPPTTPFPTTPKSVMATSNLRTDISDRIYSGNAKALELTSRTTLQPKSAIDSEKTSASEEQADIYEKFEQAGNFEKSESKHFENLEQSKTSNSAFAEALDDEESSVDVEPTERSFKILVQDGKTTFLDPPSWRSAAKIPSANPPNSPPWWQPLTQPPSSMPRPFPPWSIPGVHDKLTPPPTSAPASFPRNNGFPNSQNVPMFSNAGNPYRGDHVQDRNSEDRFRQQSNQRFQTTRTPPRRVYEEDRSKPTQDRDDFTQPKHSRKGYAEPEVREFIVDPADPESMRPMKEYINSFQGQEVTEPSYDAPSSEALGDADWEDSFPWQSDTAQPTAQFERSAPRQLSYAPNRPAYRPQNSANQRPRNGGGYNYGRKYKRNGGNFRDKVENEWDTGRDEEEFESYAQPRRQQFQHANPTPVVVDRYICNLNTPVGREACQTTCTDRGHVISCSGPYCYCEKPIDEVKGQEEGKSECGENSEYGRRICRNSCPRPELVYCDQSTCYCNFEKAIATPDRGVPVGTFMFNSLDNYVYCGPANDRNMCHDLCAGWGHVTCAEVSCYCSRKES